MIARSTLVAFLRRDLLVEASYRLHFVFEGFTALFAMLGTWFLSRTIGEHAPSLAAYGGDYFAFAVLGVAAVAPMENALVVMSARIRDAQVDGTLEPILVTPVGPARAVIYGAAWTLMWGTVRAIVYTASALLVFGVPINASGLPVAALAVALGLAAHFALGLMSAAFTIVFKRGDPVGWLVGQLSLLLGGVMFPVAVLPGPLQVVARALPVTHALECLRLSLLVGAKPSDMRGSLLALAAFVVVLTPLSMLVFAQALRRARDEGSLTHY